MLGIGGQPGIGDITLGKFIPQERRFVRDGEKAHSGGATPTLAAKCSA
jgi:hypothetical protein